MKSTNKTKEQLLKEIEHLNTKITELEKPETEQMRVEEALRIERDKLKNVFEAMEDGIYIVNQEYDIQYVNPVLTKDFGVYEGRKCYEYFHDREEVCPWCKNPDVFEGKTVRWEWYSSKNQKTYDLIDTPLKNPDGSILKLEIFRDITERKRAEKELRESEKFSKEIINSMANGFSILDENGVHIDVNLAFCEMTGFAKEELIGTGPPPPYWPEEEYKNIEEAFVKTSQGIFENFELVFKKKNGVRFPVLVNPSQIKDEKGNVKSSFATVIDITERKRAQEDLEESRERLRGLSEAAFDAIFISEKGICLEQNRNAEKMFGYSDEEAIGRMGTEWIVPEDREKVMKNMLSGYEEPYEVTALRKDGTTFPSEIQGRMMHYKGRNVRATSLRDISSRKQAEESLKTSEEKYRLLFESVPDAMTTINEQGTIISANNSVKRILGYEPSELLGKPVEILAPEELRSKQKEDIIKAINRGFLKSQETIRVTKDGTRIPIDISVFTSKDTTGKLLGISAIMRDITERKEAEKEIERLSRFPDENPDPVLRVNIEGIVYYANIASNVLLKKWKTSIGDKLPVGLMQSITNIIAESSMYNFEETCDEKVFEICCVPIENYGYINLYARNITKRKQAEEKIKEKSIQLEKQIKKSEEQRIATLSILSDLNKSTEDLQLEINVRKQTEETLLKNKFFLNEAQRIATLGSYELDFLTGYWTSSDELNNIFGIDDNYDKSVEGWENIMHAENREAMLSYLTNDVLKEHNKFDREYRIIRVSDNEERWVHGLGELEFDEDGKPVKMIGTIQDITERKEAENVLAIQRQKLTDILEGTNAGTWEWNVQTGEVTFNERWAEIIGYTLDELEPIDINTWINNVHPDDLPIANALLDKHFNREADYYDVEFRQPHKDGRWVWVNARGKVIEWTEEGKPLRMSGTHLDITKRKLAEEEIRKLSHSVEQSPAIVIITDTNGNIEYVNPKFEGVTGYTSEEVIGKNPNILKGDDSTPEDYEILWKTIKAGGAWQGEFHNKKKNGELYWESASISGIKDRNEQTTHFIAIKEDITERKAMEQRIRKSRNQLRSLAERLQMIREEERASIAREIHDDLGQTLTALKMDISWMKKNPEMTEKIRTERINTMLELTDSTIQTVKRIATELRPGILDDLGLIPAIEWETEEFWKRSGIKCNLEISVGEISVEDNTSIAVFRIFQESLTNIMRHSGATKVELTIKSKGNFIQMEITDNGVGITEEQMSSPKSLGLMGMNERVSFFGGKLTISKSEKGGTTVMVYIPIIKKE